MEFEAETAPPSLSYKSLTDGQEALLALLPIPSGILGIMGSWVVIQMAFRMRKAQSWSPYQALLTGMNVCSIFYTMTNMTGSLLYPKETSTKVWAFGNDASCKAIGAMNQFGTAVMLYQAMLCWYFVLIIRFGLSDQKIIQSYETKMHIVPVGWALLTSFAGLFLDVYGERQVSLGCWIDECPFDDAGERIPCAKSTFSNILGRGSYVFTFFFLIISSIVNWRHARKQMKDADAHASTNDDAEEAAERSETIVRGDDGETQLGEDSKKRREAAKRKRDERNLNHIRDQAILFVGGFLLCNVVTYRLNFTVGDVRRIDLYSGTSVTYAEEMELPYKYYPLLVLQSLLLPLQGFVNCLIYVRPQYIKSRRHFPQESRLWAFRRAVHGKVILPVRPEAAHASMRITRRSKVAPKSTRIMFDGSRRSDGGTAELEDNTGSFGDDEPPAAEFGSQ
ncbi:unnamed protein product [Cylindrotheca closterium]|uniref:G-protein coupled receptors family 2 profile 2 domain-containing protein n=1 Tax=Cylindrotheca closterium TaxID=2856 RepID=A0AAD2GB75_9STRA|nr:unnamed protein product [Cylindrotheca closterium]